MASAVGYSFMALAIYYTPALRVHPMQIVMETAFVGASIFYAFFFGTQVCDLKLYKITAFTLFFHWDDPYFNYRGALTLWAACVFLSVFLLSAMLLLNIFLTLDLIKTIKYPFKRQSSTAYSVISITLSALFALVDQFMYEGEYEWRKTLESAWLISITIIYLAMACISVFFAYRKLRNQGISHEVRDLVLKRHVLSIGIFIFAYAYFFVSVCIQWHNRFDDGVIVNNDFLSLLKISFILQGIYVPLTRFSEPAFKAQLKIQLHKFVFWFIFKSPEALTEH